MFGADDITRVNITPPAAFEFVTALERNIKMDCINCSHCGYPHLDLGEFARKHHRKHFCANCGRDSTWSKEEIISTPLQPLHDRYARTLKYDVPGRTLNLDEFSGHTYTIWASTPAVVWTAARPQELGIHVHVHRGRERVVDDTFGRVVLDGKSLNRGKLIEAMISRASIQVLCGREKRRSAGSDEFPRRRRIRRGCRASKSWPLSRREKSRRGWRSSKRRVF